MKINYTIKDWALVALTVFCLLLVFLKRGASDRTFDNTLATLEAENEELQQSLQASEAALFVVNAQAIEAKRRDSSLVVWYEAMVLSDKKTLQTAKETHHEKIDRIGRYGADSLRRAFASL